MQDEIVSAISPTDRPSEAPALLTDGSKERSADGLLSLPADAELRTSRKTQKLLFKKNFWLTGGVASTSWTGTSLSERNFGKSEGQAKGKAQLYYDPYRDSEWNDCDRGKRGSEKPSQN
jgi:hypothetical protein